VAWSVERGCVEYIPRLLTKAAGVVKLDLPSLAKFRMICHTTEGVS